jgi:hypothetical protein
MVRLYFINKAYNFYQREVCVVVIIKHLLHEMPSENKPGGDNGSTCGKKGYFT